MRPGREALAYSTSGISRVPSPTIHHKLSSTHLEPSRLAHCPPPRVCGCGSWRSAQQRPLLRPSTRIPAPGATSTGPAANHGPILPVGDHPPRFSKWADAPVLVRILGTAVRGVRCLSPPLQAPQDRLNGFQTAHVQAKTCEA